MTNTESAGNHGVTLENVKIEGYFEDGNLKYLCRFLILYLGAYGTIKSFLSCFDFEINSSLNSIEIFFLCIVTFIVFQFIKRYRIVVGVTTAVLLIFCIACKSMLTTSINAMLNKMNLGNGEANATGPDLCIMILSAIVIIIMAYFVIIKNKMILIALCSLPIACFGLVFGLMPDIFPLVSIGMYIGAMASISGDNIRFKNNSIEIASAVAIIIFVLFAVISVLLPEGKYRRSAVFNSLKTTIENTANNLPRLNSNDVATGGINGGQLGKYDKVIYANKIMLKLTTGDIGKVYLRSFVGASYSNNKWSGPSEKSEQKYSFLFDELDTISFEIYNQTSELMKIIDNDQELITSMKGDTASYLNSVYKREFDVENISSSGKFYYLPYGNMYYADEKSSLDGYPINNRNQLISSISYTILHPDYEKYKDLVDNYMGTNQNMIAYSDLEKSYRKFVYSSYLDVDSKYKKELQKITQNNSFHNEKEKYEIIQSIKDYLEKNYTYTLEPGAVPSGKDFLDYFLNESKQGYCTYFATAATILFREAGIPTRYVEGYAPEVNQDNLIHMEDVSSKRNSNTFDMTQNYTGYTVGVMDSDAHAWVEIYQDGYGWVPIEVTPGKSEERNNGLTSNITFTQKTDENNNAVYNVDSTDIQDNSSQMRQKLIVGDNVNRINVADIFFKFLKDVLIGMVLLVIAGGMIFIPARIKEKKTDRLFVVRSDNDFESQIIMIYSYIEKISVFLKIYRADSMSYIDYYTTVKSRYKYMEKDGIDHIIFAALKVRFAQEHISIEELNQVIQSAMTIRKDTYESLDKFNQLKYRFLYHLY